MDMVLISRGEHGALIVANHGAWTAIARHQHSAVHRRLRRFTSWPASWPPPGDRRSCAAPGPRPEGRQRPRLGLDRQGILGGPTKR